MKKRFFVFLAVLFACFSKALCLAPGNNAPELQVEKWMRGGPVSVRDGKDKNIFIIEFWATWCAPCEISMPILSAIQKENADNGVVVVSVSAEKEDVIADFLSKRPEISHAVAMDMDGKTYAAYMAEDSGIPMTFLIGKDGKLIWKGHPMEVGRILSSVLEGRFDSSKEKKIAPLRAKLQAAMQTQNGEEVKKNAFAILDIDPFDELALRMMVFYFESRNELEQALDFLSHHERENGVRLQTTILKLGLMGQTGKGRDEIRAEARKALDAFKKNHEALNSLSLFIVDGLPFGKEPLDIALEASEKSLQLLPPDAKKSRYAAYHSNFARVLYAIGRIELAVIEQEKSAKFAEDEIESKKLNDILLFYKEALESGKKIGSEHRY